MMAYTTVVSLINNDDLASHYHIPVNNWIYRIIFMAASISLFIQYYKANWGKPGKTE